MKHKNTTFASRLPKKSICGVARLRPLLAAYLKVRPSRVLAGALQLDLFWQPVLKISFYFFVFFFNSSYILAQDPSTQVAATPPPALNVINEVSDAEKYGMPENGSTPKLTTGETDTSLVGFEPQGPPTEELIYLNATDVEIKDMIKQISKATGANFLLDDKLRGKITIISEKPMSKDMAYQAFLSALDVLGYTTVTTPGGLIKIVGTKDAINEPLDIFKDQTPLTDQYITRIIQVKNISANELATVVKALVSKDGNMFAYPSTNSLILTDSGSNIDRLMKIIRELDQEGPQEVIEIIPIKNAAASDITEKVLQLYEQETGGAGAKGAGRRPPRGAAPELEEAPSISKVISDERTNSVIVLGSKRAIVKVRELIARLDSEITGVEGTIHVYYLKHANSKEMAETLSSLVSGAQAKDDKAKKGGEKAAATGAVQLEGGVKVAADEGTNSLVITASPKDYETLIERVIAKLDIPRRQVYLEAIVMELRVNKNQSIGLSGNFGSIFNLGGETMNAFGALLPLTPTALSSIAGVTGGGLAAGGFSEKNIEFTGADGATVSIPAIGAILQALESDSDVNILSSPSILTLDNEEAQIQVGAEVPVQSGATVSSSGTQFNTSREDTGVILKITPQISESDTIRLKIGQEITNIIPSTDPTARLNPAFTKRSVETVVVAQDKQTIVIGGLIDDSVTVGTSKVPYLGDVPLLGALFRHRNKEKIKTNILVFITPYIIRDRTDYLAILQKKIEERNLFIDLNYGRSQQKVIRESLRNHAKELLDYKSSALPASSQTTVSQANLNATPTVVDPTGEQTPLVKSPSKYQKPSSKVEAPPAKTEQALLENEPKEEIKEETKEEPKATAVEPSQKSEKDASFTSPSRRVRKKPKAK